MSLTKQSNTYKPFKYPEFVNMAIEHDKLFWGEWEADLREDVKQWKSGIITKEEKYHITSILRLFTQSDVVVGGSYVEQFLPHLKNNEVRMLLLSIAHRETIHARAYALLNDTLGLPEEEFTSFLEYQEMVEKVEFMNNFDTSTLSGLAKAIARTVCNEGMSLFSAFAMLLNYQRVGKMKGMCEIVEWSIRDENCFDDKTQILTPNGWKLFRDLEDSDKVAQWENGGVSFVKPNNLIVKDYKDDLVYLSSDKTPVSIMMTKNHRVLYHNDFNDKDMVKSAEDFNPHSRHWLYTSGEKVGGSQDSLEPWQRILIALQADGSIPKGENRTGEKCGHRRVSFNLTKERKKQRLRYLCDLANFEYSELPTETDGSVQFYVNIPTKYPCTKVFKDWIELEDVTSNWCKEFIEELVEWDGHKIEGSDTRYYYSSVVEDNVIQAQTIACLAGYYTSKKEQNDNRKSTYKTIHRLYITKGKNKVRTGTVTKDFVPYEGKVYCVSVPSGFIVVKRDDCIVVSGNCHSQDMAVVFRKFCEEHPRIVNDEFKKDIYLMFTKAVELEDKIVDLALKECYNSTVEGLNKDEVKQYIRYIADRRLNSLGLKEVFGIEKNPIDWIDWIVGGDSLKNFFEGRVTDYNADGMTGEWSY